MELIEYWYLLLRRKWIILSSVILAGLIGVVYVMNADPVYEADAKLLFVEDNGVSGLSGIGGGDLMLSAIGKKADPLMTQIEMLKTRPVLLQTIDTLQLKDSDSNLIQSDNLVGRLGFSVITNTNMIKLTCRSTNPQEAANILNALATIYADVNRGINRESATASREFIEKQLKMQKADLDSAEFALARYKTSTGTVSLEQETQLKIGGVAQLQTEKIRVEAELQGIDADIASFQDKINAPGARNSSKFTQWQAQLEDVQRSRVTVAAHLSKLQARINTENRALNLLPKQEIRFANLLRDSETAKLIYAGLLETYEQSKIREASNTSNIKMVEPAVVPNEPIEPQKKKIMMLALIAGFMLGFGVSLLLEYLDDTPHSSEEITKSLPYTILGSIPDFPKKTQFFARDASESFAAETMRLVHTNLKFSGIFDQKHRAIMLTSAQSGEGKTTTSMNLAYTYAELGCNTCVVNLDLRRPSFHTICGQDFGKGVTDYLIGDASLDDICFSLHDKLTVIPAGTIPPNPAVLIGTEKMMELIEILKQKFDLVIFDTPPIPIVAETLDMARHMDGIILVAALADSSMRSIKAMGQLLDGKNLPVLGVVINKVGKGTGYYGNYGKSGYTAYHNS